MDIKSKLKEIGLELPPATTPGGNYVAVNIRGKIAYIAIQFPIVDKQFFYQGKLGKTITTEDGYKAMQMCALNVLAQVDSKIGFDHVLGLNHLDAYYRASKKWDEAPAVVDGASDVFVNVLGEQGKHSRAIFGVEHLVRNFCVGLTASFTLI